MEFEGYRRPDGSVGVRNHVLVMPVAYTANHVTSRIAKEVLGVATFKHQHGNDQEGGDLEQTKRVLAGFATHPNVYGVVIVGMGYEHVSLEEIAEAARNKNKPVRVVNIIEQGGMKNSVDYGVTAAQELLEESLKVKREPVPISELILGTECGGSDACSGISANPAVGSCCDRLVENGGTAILSETMELIGAEELLAERAISPEIERRVFETIETMENRALKAGVDVRGTQPAPGNIEGGISTLEEKSLGSVRKGGTSPLMDIIDYAEHTKTNGLVWMDTTGHDSEQLVGMVAGGCQVVAFTTGRGTALGSPIAPVIKIASNTPMYERMKDNMDNNAGTVVQRLETIDQVGVRIFEMLKSVAAGQQTKSEILGHNEFGIDRIGQSL